MTFFFKSDGPKQAEEYKTNWRIVLKLVALVLEYLTWVFVVAEANI